MQPEYSHCRAKMLLSDLPEELLSHICEEVEVEALIPLAITSKVFNRIAGYHYLHRAAENKILDGRFLDVSVESYSALSKMTSIIGSLSNVTHLHYTFAKSALKTLQQMKLMVLTLRQIHHKIYHTCLTFTGFEGDLCQASSFSEIFEDLVRELQRTQCSSFEIGGAMPIPHRSLNYNLSMKNSLRSFTVYDSFILYQPRWICKFFNSSTAVTSIIARSSEAWTRILPNLSLSSLQFISFFGDIPNEQRSNIEIVARFAHRHRSLHVIDCGAQFEVLSASSKCRLPLAGITILRGTISQLCYFVSYPHVLPHLKAVHIYSEKRHTSHHDLWNLLAFISTRSMLRELILPANEPALQEALLSGDTMSSTRSKLPHVLVLKIEGFQSLKTIPDEDFIRWASQVFPNTQKFDFSWVEWSSSRKSSFVRMLTEKWPSIETLEINFDRDNVEAWCKY